MADGVCEQGFEWTEERIDASVRIAAEALIDEGEHGDVAHVIRRAEFDKELGARLAGAAAGVRAMATIARRAADSVASLAHTLDRGLHNGAAFVRLNVEASFGPQAVPVLAAPCEPGGEVAVRAWTCDAASALRGYLGSAVPRPDAAAREALMPLVAFLESIPEGPPAGPFGFVGWVPRRTAQVLERFVASSAPSARSEAGEVETARSAAKWVREALRQRDAAVAGDAVTVQFTGPQLYAIRETVVVEVPMIRPWHARDAFVVAWGDLERPARSPRKGADVLRGEEHGGTLKVPSGVAAWLASKLEAVSIADPNRSSCVFAAKRIRKAMGGE